MEEFILPKTQQEIQRWINCYNNVSISTSEKALVSWRKIEIPKNKLLSIE